MIIMDKNVHIFCYDEGQVRMEKLGEDSFKCSVIPDSPLLPTESCMVDEGSFFTAAHVLDEFKVRHHQHPSTIWNL